MKKVLLTALNVVSVAIIVFALFILLTVVMTRSGDVPNVLGYSALRVMTGSMEPALPVDSLILTKKTDPAAINAGDIISFYSDDPALGGAVNTHRVLSAAQENGRYVFTTKGDANLIADNYTVEDKDVIGKVVFSSLLVGKLARLLANPLVFIPLIILPLVVVLLSNLIKTVRLAKNAAEEEQKKAVMEAVEAIRRVQREKDEAKAAAENADGRTDSGDEPGPDENADGDSEDDAGEDIAADPEEDISDDPDERTDEENDDDNDD